MTCPVKQAIKEIRGSGVVDDAEWKLMRIVGSSESEESSTTYVCDDTAFYITTRKIMQARFELEEGTTEQCEKFIAEWGWLPGQTHREIAVRLIDTILQDHVKTQLALLADLFDQLEQYILAKIETAARRGKRFKVSIPNLAFDVSIDTGIAHDPPQLQWTMNSIVAYVNKLNLGDLVLLRDRKQIEPLGPPPQLAAPDTRVPQREDSPCKKYIDELISQELQVLDYVRCVEKYHCSAVNKMGEIRDNCNGLIKSLLAS